MENAFSLCRIAYQAFQIPVFCYQQGVLFTSYPDDPCVIPPAYIESQLAATGKPLYFTELGVCFARLTLENVPGFSLLLGPVSTLPYSDTALLELQRSYGISEQKKEVFCSIMQNTPPMTQPDFFYRLIALYYMVTQKELPLSYFIQTPQQTEVDALHQKQHETVFQQKEYALQNNSFEIEKAMLSIVREGDVAAIKKYLEEIPSYHGGDVASTPLRQQKNYFISTATLTSRAAIDGGLSTDNAYGVLRGGIFDHHLTTTVQRCCKTPKKPVVITNNGLFLVLAVNMQNQQISRFIVGLYRPVVVLRQLRQNRFSVHFCAIQRDLRLQKRSGQR